MPPPDDLHAWRAAREAQRKALRRRARAAGRTRAAGGPTPPARPPTPAQRQGRASEDQALRLLCRAGLQPLARNLRCRAGEIDLVMREGDVLVFVEVRHRASDRYGGAAASVAAAKQERLARAAAFFLPQLALRHWGARTPACRFDVVAAGPGGITWIRAAFEAVR
ncbi:YraN family protein [Orrella sp. JC864]|uniref:YraN family protein n=1 Tax=Orrella sp. JC864 TaxID=3120298 RepID=UPI003008075B